jgi:malonyl-CoA O-methyltransferase
MSAPLAGRLDMRAVHQAFDRAAPDYDRHAVLQHEVEQRLLERLEFLRVVPANVLDIGCGTGIASHNFKQRYRGAMVIGLDWSTGMLRQLQSRADGPSSPLALCANMQALPLPARSMDVVFSNLAIQWSPDPEELFRDIRRVLKPGGMLLFSTFGPDTLQELRSAWSVADKQPHVNRFADMHDIGDMVVAAGFAEPVFDVDVLTLEYRDVISLMRDLKAIGAHNAASGRSPGLTGKDKFAQVISAYEDFRLDGVYPATYEVIYAVAFGPREGQPVRTADGDVVTFSVEALQASRKGPAS